MRKSLKINAFLNLIKSVFAIAVPLLSFSYVSRVLMPENYGKVSYCLSIVSYFSLIAALGIVNYATRECSKARDDKARVNDLANKFFSINLLSTLLSSILLVAFLLIWDKGDEYKILTLVLAIEIPFTCLGVSWVFSVFEDFVYISLSSIALNLIRLVLTYIFVKSSNDLISYAFIVVTPSVLSGLFGFLYARRFCKIHFTFSLDLKKHLLPLCVLFINGIISTIYLSSDQTMLGSMVGDASVGYYRTAVNIYNVMKTILVAIITVFIPRLSLLAESRDKTDFSLLINKLLRFIITFMLPVAVGTFALSENAILITAGSDYSNSITPLRILSISLFFSYLAYFFTSAIMLPLKKDKKCLLVTSISALLNILLNLAFIPTFGCIAAATTTLLSEILVSSLTFMMVREFILKKELLRTLASSIVGSALIMCSCFLLSRLNINNIFILTVLQISISAIIYFFPHFLLKNSLVHEMLAFIKKRKA